MKPEDFLAFTIRGWPSLGPGDYTGLHPEEAREIQQAEQGLKEILWADLSDLCQKCSDRLPFAEAYRKAAANTEWLTSRWPGHANHSQQGNLVAREMMVRHWNIFLNGMAIWFNGMLGDESRAAKQPPHVIQQRGVELLHDEIRQYGATRHAESTTPQTQSNASTARTLRADSSGCLIVSLLTLLALGSSFLAF